MITPVGSILTHCESDDDEDAQSQDWVQDREGDHRERDERLLTGVPGEFPDGSPDSPDKLMDVSEHEVPRF